jgi:hypothetical protein
MSIVSSALRVLDKARAKLDVAGLCPYRVFSRVRTWNGPRPGAAPSAGVQPSFTDVDTELTVADGKRPQVRLSGSKSIVAPGGVLAAGTYEVGPLTPAYSGGGVTVSVIDPPGTTSAELLFVVMGPGLPATGMLCKKASDDLQSPFRYVLTLTALGQKA